MRRSRPGEAWASRKPANTLPMVSSELIIARLLVLRAAREDAFVRKRGMLELRTRFFPQPALAPSCPDPQRRKAAVHVAPLRAISPSQSKPISGAEIHITSRRRAWC